MTRLFAVFQFTPLRLAVAVCWSALLTMLLLQGEADPVIDLGIPRGENTVARELIFGAIHLAAFAATCFCWFWSLPLSWALRRRLFLASLLAMGLGISTELLQTYTLDRYASWLDLAANIGGALIAARLIWQRHSDT